MQLISQSYYIPKAGGTNGFRLLSDEGAPLTLTSVSCSTSSVNSSITYDKPNYSFSATFPANSYSSLKTYRFTVVYSLNGTSHTDTFDVQQTGTANYVKSVDFYGKPFVQTLETDFVTNMDPSTFADPYITSMEYNAEGESTFPARHYRSVTDYIAAMQARSLTAGEWVYVDGKVNSAESSSYNANGYLSKLVFIDADVDSPTSSTNPKITFTKLYNTGYTKFTSNPSADTKATYKTIGFKHNNPLS